PSWIVGPLPKAHLREMIGYMSSKAKGLISEDSSRFSGNANSSLEKAIFRNRIEQLWNRSKKTPAELRCRYFQATCSSAGMFPFRRKLETVNQVELQAVQPGVLAASGKNRRQGGVLQVAIQSAANPPAKAGGYVGLHQPVGIEPVLQNVGCGAQVAF